MARTAEQEAALEVSLYHADSYFTNEQWLSHLGQVKLVRKCSPESVLEVGIGNGLTSSILKWFGYKVTTADVNANLRPDHIVSVCELCDAVGKKAYDVVLCAEVLEHLPFEVFDSALEQLTAAARKRVVLTIPEPRRQLFYFEMKLPKFNPMKIDIKVPHHSVAHCHYWELGVVPIRQLESVIQQHASILETGHLDGNSYHRHYILKPNEQK